MKNGSLEMTGYVSGLRPKDAGRVRKKADDNSRRTLLGGQPAVHTMPGTPCVALPDHGEGSPNLRASPESHQ